VNRLLSTPVSQRVFRAISMMALAVAFRSGAALAQSDLPVVAHVRVVTDRTMIWQRDAPVIVAATVKLGTVLEVVGREGERYVVVIPPEYGGKGELGLIAASQVEIVGREGTPPQIARPPQSPASPPPARRAQARRQSPVSRAVEVFGFGDIGDGSWLAHDTFNAVLGSSSAPMLGGGVQVRFRSLFVEGSVERFQKSGTRVFVSGGEVFNLGIADTVRIIPIAATVGYRRAGRRFTPYLGAGIGTHLYRETSDFADPSENVSEHFTSYHVLAGVEFASRRWLRAALEMQFTTVPSAFGTTGASAAFNEHNLGGVHGRLKIMVGR
jgi:opacity protein-like surface antigen